MKTPVIKVHIASNLVHVGKSSLALIIQKSLTSNADANSERNFCRNAE